MSFYSLHHLAPLLLLPFTLLPFTLLPFTLLPFTLLPFTLLPFTLLPFTPLRSTHSTTVSGSDGLLPSASANHLQYISYVGTSSGGDYPSWVFGTSHTQKPDNYIYSFGDAVAKLGHGDHLLPPTTRRANRASTAFVPNTNGSSSGSAVLPYLLVSVNAAPAPQGYTVAFAKAAGSTLGTAEIYGVGGNPLIGPICSVLSLAIANVEPRRKSLQKVTAVVEADVEDIDNEPCEMYFAVETWGPPIASTLNGSCTQWVGDLVSWNNNTDDGHTRGGVRMVGKGAMLGRFIMAVKPGISHA